MGEDEPNKSSCKIESTLCVLCCFIRRASGDWSDKNTKKEGWIDF